MVEVFTARSGALSLKVDGVAMHSPYDPEREAARFVQQALGADPPSAVIVLGESVGHLVDAVARQRPSALLLSALYSSEIAAASRPPRVPCWSPDTGMSFGSFLRQHLGELQIEGLRVIEWPPSARAFPEVSRACNEAVRQVVQELNGSLVTTVSAGRLWLRNCVANFMGVERAMTGPLCTPGRAVVIAASGPSLEDSIGLLRELRNRFDLWALPSACPALAGSGLEPDLVVLTDPGFYAMHHLHFAPPRVLAMPLSGARGSWSLPSRPAVVLLEQPFAHEQAFLNAVGLPAPPRVPPHGTVAATAIQLALDAASGPVLLAGLDLCERDLLSHARPNAFDTLLSLQSSRTAPHTGLTFQRAQGLGSKVDAGGARLTPALRTYAGWFDAAFAGHEGRLYRVLPTAVPVAGAAGLSLEASRRLLAGVPVGREHGGPRQPGALPSAPQRRHAALGILESWAREVGEARAALKVGGQPWDASRFPQAVELAFLSAPRRLLDSLRQARRGDEDSARRAAGETFSETSQFLEALAGSVRG
ncbi:MAG TPA: 6-hydroxymethylpterin diphosphokinase MptE-like protein [Spirochaetia bacterium]|nr:6-hydroxymethylpterin diphosphokinase MptE-like protein [Spirochaetia bacterium]